MADNRWNDEDRYRRDEARRDDDRSYGRRAGEPYRRGGERGRHYGDIGFVRDLEEVREDEAALGGSGRGDLRRRDRFGEDYERGDRFDDIERNRAYTTGGGYIGRFGPGERDGRRAWSDRSQERRQGEERPWLDRAGDEVSSWFGDEEAEERRRRDRERSHFGRGPRGYVRSDERIRDDVSDRLTEDWHVDASDIEVVVSEGEVTLNGTVQSRHEKRRAEDLAEDCSGVKHVQNNLRVQPASQGLSREATAAGGTTPGILTPKQNS